MNHQVFISHCTNKTRDRTGEKKKNPVDSKVAKQICSFLEEGDISCWLADRDLKPGEEWLETILRAINQASIVILVFSMQSNSSKWVKDEISIALKENKTIIPIRIDDSNPEGSLNYLESKFQWLDASQPPLELHLKQLVSSVRNILNKDNPIDLENIPGILTITGKNKKHPLRQKWRTASTVVVCLAVLIFVILQFSNAKPPANHGLDVKKPVEVKAIEEKMENSLDIRLNKEGFWEIFFKEFEFSMVYIPPGEFTMGQTKVGRQWLIDLEGRKNLESKYNDETPSHKVFLDGYWIGKTEVTVKLYMRFAGETESNYPIWLAKGILTGNGDHIEYRIMAESLTRDMYPVVGVSWENARAFCRWMSNKTGLPFDLPTEAQWEKAARGICKPGNQRRIFPWGNKPPGGKQANLADRQLALKEIAKSRISGRADKEIDDGYPFTAPVDSFPNGASQYGLLNMAGNVWEWCLDTYDKSLYEDGNQENPVGSGDDTYRVMRGGSWASENKFLRCAYREFHEPVTRSFVTGFRLSIHFEKKIERLNCKN